MPSESAGAASETASHGPHIIDCGAASDSDSEDLEPKKPTKKPRRVLGRADDGGGRFTELPAIIMLVY
jgi:hypothetical protein